MAESPFKITQGDDGLSVRCEFDAHYVSDEDAQRICGYIDQLQAENVKLQDENARLRSCLSDDAENARMIMAENVKLRELVRHLRECTRHNVCAVCEYADDACDFDYDMRELGIEVEQ